MDIDSFCSTSNGNSVEIVIEWVWKVIVDSIKKSLLCIVQDAMEVRKWKDICIENVKIIKDRLLSS